MGKRTCRNAVLLPPFLRNNLIFRHCFLLGFFTATIHCDGFCGAFLPHYFNLTNFLGVRRLFFNRRFFIFQSEYIWQQLCTYTTACAVLPFNAHCILIFDISCCILKRNVFFFYNCRNHISHYKNRNGRKYPSYRHEFWA